MEIDDLLMCDFCRQKSQTYQDNDPTMLPCLDCDVKFDERLKLKLTIDSNQKPSAMRIATNEEFFKNKIIQSLLKQLAEEYCGLLEKIKIKISIIQELLKQRNDELDKTDHTDDYLNEFIQEYRHKRNKFVDQLNKWLEKKCKELYPPAPG